AALHAADEAHAGVLQHPAQGAGDALDLGVVRGDAVAHQAVGGGQPVQYVHPDGFALLAGQGVGGVHAGRPGPDDRDPQGLGRTHAPHCRPSGPRPPGRGRGGRAAGYCCAGSPSAGAPSVYRETVPISSPARICGVRPSFSRTASREAWSRNSCSMPKVRTGRSRSASRSARATASPTAPTLPLSSTTATTRYRAASSTSAPSSGLTQRGSTTVTPMPWSARRSATSTQVGAIAPTAT